MLVRNPNLLLPGDTPVEVWDRKVSIEEFVNKRFIMDIDLYYQTPYIKHKMNFTDVAFLYYNGIKDIT